MKNIMKTWGLMALLMMALPLQAQKLSKQKRAVLGTALCDSAMVVYLEDGEEKSEPLFLQALKHLEGTGQIKKTIVTLRFLALINRAKNDYDSTIYYYDRALLLARQNHEQVYEMDLLIKKKSVYQVLERWDENQDCLLKIDSLINVTDKVEAQVKGMAYLAKEAYDTGKTEVAENLYGKVVDMCDSIDVTLLREELLNAYYGLHEISMKKGDFLTAAQYYKKRKETMEEINGKMLPYDLVVYLIGMQRMYLQAEDKERYCQYEDSVMNILPELQNQNVKELAYFFSASSRRVWGDLELSVDYAIKADSIMRLSSDKVNDSRESTLIMIIEQLIQLGRNDEARIHMKEYLDVYQKLYGKPSVKYAKGLCMLAQCEAYMGDTKAGAQYYIEGSKMMMEKFREQIRIVSSEQREAYWQNLSNLLFGMSGYGLKVGLSQDEFTAAAYNALLFSKGLLLASDRSTADIISEKGTEDDVALYNEINQLRTELEALSASDNPDRDRMETLYAKLLGADSRLVAQCAAYDNIDKFADDDFERVRNALGKDDVLIDLSNYESASTGKNQYVAYIISRDSQYPLLVPVCFGEDVDSLIGKVSSTNVIYTSLADELSKICLQPLLPFFTKKGRVYVVPSGMYHQIAFEALPVSGGVACDKYRISRLTSARELCNPRKGMHDKVSATLYGGLNYNVDPEEMALESAKYDVSSLFALRGDELRDATVFSPLPYTKTEVENIGATLQNKADVKVFEGNTGTEESFLAMSGHSPEIIHLATHGFYYTPQEAMATVSLAGYKNAMHLSGVVMAGGNAALTGVKLSEGTLEGLLTADDIAQINLDNTQLVCLSACDTGKGKVTPDGVYGLQRALKKAGVGSIVMCLWKASDMAANLFMTEFYKAYAQGKWDARKAFEKARKIVRKAFPEPFYWAGFVLVD